MNVNEQLHISTIDNPSDENDDQLQEVVNNVSLHSTDGLNQAQTYIGKSGMLLALIEAVLMIGLVVLTFVLPHTIDVQENVEAPALNSKSVSLYAHCFVWLITFVFDLLFSRHHRQLKLKGFLRFYRSVKYLQHHPFFVKSLFQTIYVLLANFFGFCQTDNGECKILTLRSIDWLQILTSAETAIMFIGLVIYMGRIVVHNKYHQLPDDADEQMLASFRFHGLDTGGQGVGYRPDNYMDDIIENQADRIRSLQEQNAVLSRKLYSLTYQHNRLVSHSK